VLAYVIVQRNFDRHALQHRVSNFQKRHLESLMSSCEIPPFLNQIEVSLCVSWVDGSWCGYHAFSFFQLHPLNYELELETIAFCSDHQIAVGAYCPLGQGDPRLLQNEQIKHIAQKHRKSPGQVVLRWGVQKGFVVVPKSTTLERIKQNVSIYDFHLEPNEVNIISAVGRDVEISQRKLLWDSGMPCSPTSLLIKIYNTKASSSRFSVQYAHRGNGYSMI
jgi:diketogulonate reductase-like aldo/keto reductase